MKSKFLILSIGIIKVCCMSWITQDHAYVLYLLAEMSIICSVIMIAGLLEIEYTDLLWVSLQ